MLEISGPRDPPDGEYLHAAGTSSTADWGPAPRGRHGWPLVYAMDMAFGFAAVQKFQTTMGMKLPDAFQAAFPGHTYKSSTYNDHFRAWEAAGHVAGEQERWIGYGRTSQGLWSAFAKMWKGRKRSS